jgi:TetR/AcrR family transcriptional repressor of multidrug resistance operon
VSVEVDRAAAVRAALRQLVAERGFHGASMSAVARAAGVATGTAYTHYESKDALVLAAYAETKAELAAVAVGELDQSASASERFRSIWLATYRHFAANPEHARFLLQVDHSPYRAPAHARAADDDPLAAQASELAAELLELPLDVLYELSIAPAVRLAAAETQLADAELSEIADACWRAISRDPSRASPA